MMSKTVLYTDSTGTTLLRSLTIATKTPRKFKKSLYQSTIFILIMPKSYSVLEKINGEPVYDFDALNQIRPQKHPSSVIQHEPTPLTIQQDYSA